MNSAIVKCCLTSMLLIIAEACVSQNKYPSGESLSRYRTDRLGTFSFAGKQHKLVIDSAAHTAVLDGNRTKIISCDSVPIQCVRGNAFEIAAPYRCRVLDIGDRLASVEVIARLSELPEWEIYNGKTTLLGSRAFPNVVYAYSPDAGVRYVILDEQSRGNLYEQVKARYLDGTLVDWLSLAGRDDGLDFMTATVGDRFLRCDRRPEIVP